MVQNRPAQAPSGENEMDGTLLNKEAELSSKYILSWKLLVIL